MGRGGTCEVVGRCREGDRASGVAPEGLPVVFGHTSAALCRKGQKLGKAVVDRIFMRCPARMAGGRRGGHGRGFRRGIEGSEPVREG